MDKNSHYSFFGYGDLNAFWALFADNLANIILIVSVFSTVFFIPDTIIFGRLIPGVGVSLIVGLGYYAYLANRLALKEKRQDVTALPYGISTPVMFTYLFLVIGPVYSITHDPISAWRVGIAAAFIGGIIEILGSVIGPLIKRVTPRAGMLGSLAGIALVFIATIPLAEIYEHPIIGFSSIAITFFGLIGLRRLPFNIPAGLFAIMLGTAIGFCTGDSGFSTKGIGIYYPCICVTDLYYGLRLLFSHSEILTVVIPIEVYNFIETMNNVESAEASGDSYPVRSCQIADGVGTIIGAIFGSAFPTTVYIGHPGYKRLGARAGYALLVGVVFFIAGIFGLVSFVYHLVPIAAVAPILVFIGLVVTAQAFNATPPGHSIAVAMAMIPHISSLLITKLNSLAQCVNQLLKSSINLTDTHTVADMLRYGIHYPGQLALGSGAILIGLVWGAITAHIVDRRYIMVFIFSISAAILTATGLIHSSSLGLHLSKIFWGYTIISIISVLLLLNGRAFRKPK